MRDAFNIVRGAVSKKDLVPVLTHFAINKGWVHGFNGRVHIAAPAKEITDLSFTVPATLAMAAMDACKGEPIFTPKNGRIAVRDTASKFNAILPTGKVEDFPLPEQSQLTWQKCETPFLKVLQALQPFIGEDASRLWCASIRFQGPWAMATDNVTLAQCASPLPMLDCALPVFAVDELLRIAQEPLQIAQEGTHSLFFRLPGRVWLRTQLIADAWPDAIAMLNKVHEGATLQEFDVNMVEEAVRLIQPLCPDPKLPIIVFDETTVSTKEGNSEARFPGFQHLGNGTYRAEALLKMLSVAVRADWSKFPRIPWEGRGVRGALMGVMA
jgi:DNA polymerase III sliding clamp (beta) subunit (PCNA family)